MAKHGYIEDESMTKKERVRPWHIKKVKTNLSDSDDSDEWYININKFIKNLNN